MNYETTPMGDPEGFGGSDFGDEIEPYGPNQDPYPKQYIARIENPDLLINGFNHGGNVELQPGDTVRHKYNNKIYQVLTNPYNQPGDKRQRVVINGSLGIAYVDQLSLISKGGNSNKCEKTLNEALQFAQDRDYSLLSASLMAKNIANTEGSEVMLDICNALTELTNIILKGINDQ